MATGDYRWNGYTCRGAVRTGVSDAFGQRWAVMLIAHITDLHIGFDRGNPHELNVRRLNMVVDQIRELRPRPDLLIVSGDLVEHSDDPHAYDHAHALVGRFEGPTLFAVGNHDGRAAFSAELPQVPRDPNGFVQYEVEHGGVRFIVLDTLDEGRHGGAFCEARAGWLAERLAERTDQPTLLMLHHPPLDTGIPWMSALPGEAWVERLRAVVEPARQVRAMLCGHVHRPIAATFAGKPLVVAPSTAPQIALDLEDVDPTYPDGRALIIADPPAYALHNWDGERLLTHFEVAGPRHVLATYNSNLQPMMRAFLKERGTG
ncbi:phosphodiesterase [Sphingomonas sp. BN140010]|uniref:Phosphodiesterase n=1 Tax=Sphingomonas arvum TaxID=2992113 RepID=A0ABT3JCA3_9SPHN|nr:phosphodiesterase [Sphingomonas sp. BN140010]MCW3796700.1 phosphodiesterase [Sphingomonas sp. BN140010]